MNDYFQTISGYRVMTRFYRCCLVLLGRISLDAVVLSLLEDTVCLVPHSGVTNDTMSWLHACSTCTLLPPQACRWACTQSTAPGKMVLGSEPGIPRLACVMSSWRGCRDWRACIKGLLFSSVPGVLRMKKELCNMRERESRRLKTHRNRKHR